MAIAVVATKNNLATRYSTLAVYLSLHTGDPGTTGVNEVSGGSYARVAITWGTASGGVITGTATMNVPASTTATWGGAWSAVTAGTFIDSVDVADQSFISAGSLLVSVSYTQI